MIEETNDQLEISKCGSSTTRSEIDESNRANETEQAIKIVENEMEQSFEVISPASMESANANELHQAENREQRSDSEARDNSLQARIKKSGSFLAKLQSSSEENEGTNLPSSLASALSSFSSFTSNFTLNSNGNNNNSSNLNIETASSSTRMSQIVESREEIFLKKASIERKNLISLTKLIVKDLISSSLNAGRTIDDFHSAVHLSNYFTLIDRVLKHGLKQNLLSNRSAGLWNALDSLPKYLKESTLMSESVRSLANAKSADGKIKAWMRLAMMQKKLPEYFNELLANKNILLRDIYHDYAFILNDEAQVFAGLIIGVNVIDCNFFVKDANFDLMDDIIDLSPYLRAANGYDADQDERLSSSGEQRPAAEAELEAAEKLGSLKRILDQKNYLEEWNRRLQSTIDALQGRIKTLEDHSSRLEMEAKVSEVRIAKLLDKRGDTPIDRLSGSPIADAIKNFMGNQQDPQAAKSQQPGSRGAVDEAQAEERTEEEQALVGDHENSAKSSEELDRLRSSSEQQAKELAGLRERAGILETSYRGALERIKALERDVDVQTSMNADRETTIKMYEKDIRDKQAQVESLRVSLNDSKKLNSEISERLGDVSAKLKDRVKCVSNLQSSLDKWKLENKTLASRLHERQASLVALKKELESATKSIEELRRYNVKINEELRRERESGQSSSVTLETQNERIAELSDRLQGLELELKDTRPYRSLCEELTNKCRDYEQSLEEMGVQLRESRLEAESLKENSAVFLDSQWMDSRQVKSCALCQQSFSVTRRKHHCRLCGNVFCQSCSDNKMELASSSRPVRVCDTCHSFLLAKFVKNASQ